MLSYRQAGVKKIHVFDRNPLEGRKNSGHELPCANTQIYVLNLMLYYGIFKKYKPENKKIEYQSARNTNGKGQGKMRSSNVGDLRKSENAEMRDKYVWMPVWMPVKQEDRVSECKKYEWYRRAQIPDRIPTCDSFVVLLIKKRKKNELLKKKTI